MESVKRILSEVENSSASRRRSALEWWVNLPESESIPLSMRLMGSSYRDVRDDVVEYCIDEFINCELMFDEVAHFIEEKSNSMDENMRQSLLRLMASFPLERVFSPSMTRFYRGCFDAEDGETRYRALCLAEYREDTSSEYAEDLRRWLRDEDEDFRIVSIQGIARLKPSWGREALLERVGSCGSLEAFHLQTALVALSVGEARAPHLRRIVEWVGDSRFTYPAIKLLEHYGTGDAWSSEDRAEAIEALLRVVRGVLGEATVRTVAAGAAAKLGSEEGRRWLEKFSKLRHGNPELAKALLLELGDRNENADK